MAETLKLKCPKCRQTLALDPAFAGGVCRCRACGEVILVPKPNEARDDGDDPLGGVDPRPEAPANVGTGMSTARARLQTPSGFEVGQRAAAAATQRLNDIYNVHPMPRVVRTADPAAQAAPIRWPWRLVTAVCVGALVLSLAALVLLRA